MAAAWKSVQHRLPVVAGCRGEAAGRFLDVFVHEDHVEVVGLTAFFCSGLEPRFDHLGRSERPALRLPLVRRPSPLLSADDPESVHFRPKFFIEWAVSPNDEPPPGLGTTAST